MLEHLPEYHEQITALDLYCRRHCEPLHGARLGRRDRRLHLHSFDGRHGLADQHVIAAGDGDGDGDDSSPRHCATSSTSPYRQPSSGSAQHRLRRDWLNVPRCQRKISLCARGATRSTCIVNGIDDVPVGGTPGTT